jgi:two-component system sensor histidine kinase GlrK
MDAPVVRDGSPAAATRGDDGRARALHLALRRLRRQWRRLLIRLARLRPRSFRALLIAGFSAVAIPLAGAIVATSFEVNRLAADSQEAINRAVSATLITQYLVDDVDATERMARRYMVLRDRDLFDAYISRKTLLLDRAQAVLQYLPDQRNTVKVFIADVNAMHGLLRQRYGRNHRQEIVDYFAGLARMATELSQAANAQATREAEEMRARAEHTRTLLFWQAFALIAVSMLLSWYFLRIIGKPVRDIDSAIRALGDGGAEGAIRVDGPQDFVELGHRLEWLRSRLGEAEAQKSRFLRHVSHELKTPMTAIREGSNLLLEEVPGPLNAMQREVAGIVRDNARRLEHLIEDLLGITRLPRGIDYRDDWRNVRLDETVQQVLRAHTLSFTSKNMTVVTDLPPSLVRGSPSALATIVDNLVSNAVKYSPGNGVLRITLHNEADRARLDVEDDGPGIAPADRDAIFEPFFRGSRQPEIQVEGTGLGLTIAREAAAAHGGEINVVDGLGTGGCMRLTLPRLPELQVAAHGEGTHEH